jgi:hypothetical protein
MDRGQLATVGAGLLIGYGWNWNDFVHQMSQPSSIRGRYLIALLIWLIVAMAWIARRVARAITVYYVSKQKAATFAYWRRWLITPLMLGATLIVCWTRLPEIIGFWLSKSALEKTVRDVRAVPSTPGLMRGGYYVATSIGVYPPRELSRGWIVNDVWERGDETWIYVQNNGAFIYRDGGQPPSNDSLIRARKGLSHVHHLYGPWYSVDWPADF